MLTAAQLQLLKNAIVADSVLNALPKTPDANDQIAQAFNALPSPDFWVWRTNVTRSEIYNNQNDVGVSPDDFWNWATYKAQAAVEQNAWTQMFMGDQADFSKSNLRAGVASIFSGSAPQTKQLAHILAIGRRKARRIEKTLATGTGSTASPAVMGYEGTITYSDVETARNLP